MTSFQRKGIMKLKALVTAEVVREKLQERFAEQIEFTYDGYYLDHEVMPHAELVEKVKGYDILICEYDTVSKDVIDAADRLRLIICCRGGVKSVIDLDAARMKGIVVCNNAGRNAGAVTDLTMAFILDLTRNITKTSNLIHSGHLVGEVSTKPGEYKDTVLEDGFFKCKSTLYMFPDFVLGNADLPAIFKSRIDEKRRAVSTSSYFLCHDCLNRDFDLPNLKHDKCPICGSNNYEIVDG